MAVTTAWKAWDGSHCKDSYPMRALHSSGQCMQEGLDGKKALQLFEAKRQQGFQPAASAYTAVIRHAEGLDDRGLCSSQMPCDRRDPSPLGSPT